MTELCLATEHEELVHIRCVHEAGALTHRHRSKGRPNIATVDLPKLVLSPTGEGVPPPS